ncbi:FadR family transcriptional regulator [Alicyclobacillus curvatus]|nr:FadR family transcriptional regulator [Alicyclobacillus curvatus]
MSSGRQNSPITVQEAHEMRILQIVAKMDAPVGSRILRQQLLEHGIDFSEATAGRWLSELSSLGLLKDHGRLGRTLTSAGRVRLRKLEKLHDDWSHVSDLLQIYEAADPEHLIDLLTARRLIEPEIARLAAIHANRNDLERIGEALHKRDELLQLYSTDSSDDAETRRARILAETDVTFHMAIADAAHSPALTTVIRLLRSAEPHFPVFHKVRETLGYRTFEEHSEIAAAIFQRNETRAKDLMFEHISGVLNDISRYTSRHGDGRS